MCSPSRAELQTGRYDRRSGIGQILDSKQPAYELPVGEETLGDIARRAGRTTGLVGKWHLASLEEPGAATHPQRSGFDYYAGSLANLRNSIDDYGDKLLDYWTWEKDVGGELSLSRQYATVDTIDEAIGFVDRTAEPWLLVVSFNAAHEPDHEPPNRLVYDRLGNSSTRFERYQASIEAADHELSRLLRRIDAGVLASTTIIVMGDNGTPGEVLPEAMHPERHKGTLFEGGIRVPLVVAGPWVAVPGSSSDALVHLVDVFPTVAEILDEQPAAAMLDGRSLVPLLGDPAASDVHDSIASFLFEPVGSFAPERLQQAIRDRTHKLVIGTDGTESLYEVGPDAIFEGDDLLAEPHSKETQDLATALHVKLEALDATFTPEP